MSDMPLIRLTEVTKTYHLESGDFTALDHVSLDIAEGEFVAIMGPSGSGKSTMMNQLGILDVPTSGELYIARQKCGNDVKSRTDPYAPGYHRVRLPEILSHPPSFRIRERGVPAHPQVQKSGTRQDGLLTTSVRWASIPIWAPTAQPAFRGTAAACRHCTGTGQRSKNPSLR